MIEGRFIGTGTRYRSDKLAFRPDCQGGACSQPFDVNAGESILYDIDFLGNLLLDFKYGPNDMKRYFGRFAIATSAGAVSVLSFGIYKPGQGVVH